MINISILCLYFQSTYNFFTLLTEISEILQHLWLLKRSVKNGGDLKCLNFSCTYLFLNFRKLKCLADSDLPFVETEQPFPIISFC